MPGMADLDTTIHEPSFDPDWCWHSAPEGRSPNLRRLLVDLQDEYARHVGHADLFREAVDGLVGEDPPR